MDKFLELVSRVNSHLVPDEDAADLAKGATYIPFAVTEARRLGQVVKFEIRRQLKFYAGKHHPLHLFWVMPDGTRLIHDAPEGPSPVYEDEKNDYVFTDDWSKLCCMGLPYEGEKPCGYAFRNEDAQMTWTCGKHSTDELLHEAAKQAAKDGTHTMGNCSGFPEFKVIHWQK